MSFAGYNKGLFRILFLLMIMFSSAPASDWHIIPYQGREDFNGLHFLSEDRGFLVSKQGSIFSLKKNGNEWDISKTETKYSLENILFINDGKKGFAFGSEGVILSTIDTGQSWQVDTIIPDIRFCNMIFFDSLNGIIAGTKSRQRQGKNGAVFRTTDGGKSWNSLKIDCWRIEAVHISPEGVGTITSRMAVYISRDKGKSWVESHISPNVTAKATIVSGKRGVMVGMGGYLAFSDDYGATWERYDIFTKFTEKISFHNMLKIDNLQFLIVGTNGEIFYTDDGGQNWIPEPSSAAYDLLDIQMVGDNIFACGKKGALIFTRLVGLNN